MMILMISLIAAMSAQAQDAAGDGAAARLNKDLERKPFLAFTPALEASTAPAPELFGQQVVTVPAKSAPKGLFFSLMFPGLGEFYAHSWLKGLFFLGVEATAWTIYAKNHNEGEDLKKEFMAYAEEHWSEQAWNDWWNSQPQATRDQFAHHTLPETKTQQWYEMIGKYQKYNAGWDDVDPAVALTDTSANSLYYMQIRGRSNDKLKMATSATAIVLVNHVLSALDAVWTVNRYNRRVKPSVRIKYVMLNHDPVPAVNLNLAW